MAGKRNPINFENLGGMFKKNLGEFLKVQLTLISEHQRDLVGSSVARDFPIIVVNLQQQLNRAVIAARIHHTLAAASVEVLLTLSKQTGIDTIVLSGGVFQNRLLFESLTRQMQQHGKTVLSPRTYPMNDGGIALGQAVIVAARTICQKELG